MAPMMDPEDDYITIAATEQQTSTTKSNRKKELEEAYSNLKGGWIHKSRILDFDTNTSLVALVRVLDSARTSATRPSTVPTATDHRATVNELDATRLSLAKAINEAESSLASREAELASLKEEAKVLEECDPAAEHERELNGTTSVFVSLPLSGTDLVWWSGCDYKYIRGWALSPSRIKMADLLRCSFVSRLKIFHKVGHWVTIVRTSGAESGDVHCVSFDDNRKSNAEYTDLLWKLASSWYHISLLRVSFVYNFIFSGLFLITTLFIMVWLPSLITQVFEPFSNPTTLFSNNQSAITTRGRSTLMCDSTSSTGLLKMGSYGWSTALLWIWSPMSLWKLFLHRR